MLTESKSHRFVKTMLTFTPMNWCRHKRPVYVISFFSLITSHLVVEKYTLACEALPTSHLHILTHNMLDSMKSLL